MKITEALLRDHRAFHTEFEDLEKGLQSGATSAEIEAQLEALDVALDTHAQLEEELLFAKLEPHIGPNGPLAVMRTEHGEIQDAFSLCRSLRQEDRTEFQESGNVAATAESIAHLLATARPHFAKEEEILFPMAEELLDSNTLEQLGLRFANRRRAVMI